MFRSSVHFGCFSMIFFATGTKFTDPFTLRSFLVIILIVFLRFSTHPPNQRAHYITFSSLLLIFDVSGILASSVCFGFWKGSDLLVVYASAWWVLCCSMTHLLVVFMSSRLVWPDWWWQSLIFQVNCTKRVLINESMLLNGCNLNNSMLASLTSYNTAGLLSVGIWLAEMLSSFHIHPLSETVVIESCPELSRGGCQWPRLDV